MTGTEPTSDRHDVDVHLGSVAEDGSGDAVGTHQRREPDTGTQVDPLAGVQPGDESADLLAEHGRERRRLRLHQHHVETTGPHARRQLAADEPRPDDQCPLALGEVRAQRQAFVDGPENVDAREVGQTRYPPRHEAGGDHQFVVAEFGAVGESQDAGSGVHRGRLDPQTQLDVLLVEELTRLERGVARLPAHHFLRQRWAVVGKVRFPAEKNQVTLVSGPPEFLGCAQTCQARSDDHNSLHCPVPAQSARATGMITIACVHKSYQTGCCEVHAVAVNTSQR